MQMTIYKHGQIPSNLRKAPAKVSSPETKSNLSATDNDLLNASTGELNPIDCKRSLLAKRTKTNRVKADSDSIQSNLANDETKHKVESTSFVETAQQLEQVRTKLFGLIVNNNAARSVMAKEYLFNVDNGESASELYSLNRSDFFKDQQESDCDKQSAKQIEHLITAVFRQIADQNSEKPSSGVIHKQMTFIKSIHFLPIYLLQVANRIKSQAGSKNASHFDAGFLKQLRQEGKRITDLRTAMVTSNLGLVKYMSRQYRTQNMTAEDLQQEGVIGLLKAVDRFDHRREFRFSTYASYWVRQTITRSMGKHEKLIRIPINLAPKAPAVFQMIDSRLLETNRIPSVAELSKLCKMTEDEISTILEFYRPTISLDGENSDDNETRTMLDLLEQQQFPSAINSLADFSLKNTLKMAINSLPEKEACVIRCRYGLENQTEMTLQDIANRLEVTRERVRQIQNSGLKKLNLKFGNQLNTYLEAD